MKRTLAILGSTGSIGTQTLDIVAHYPDRFDVYALTANNNVELLVQQARQFEPEVVVIANEARYEELKKALSDLPIKVWSGVSAIAEVVEAEPIDMVVTAMVGFSGLRPTINAIKAKKIIALANKETLVVAGELINALVQEVKTSVLPVDSEHSALFQCIVGEEENSISELLLTASGGPFLNTPRERLEKITKEEALHHPNWAMGSKVTIDSATLMNKGLEMIEARWLFNVPSERIKVVVHPQSIIHSMVRFVDGSVKAQLGVPDMRLPIGYALSFPERMHGYLPDLDFLQIGTFTFREPDINRFPCLMLAYNALDIGGTMPCIMNAANEVAVSFFLNDKIKFTAITSLIQETMNRMEVQPIESLEQLIEVDDRARREAEIIVKRYF